MRHHHPASDHHQIVDPDARPLAQAPVATDAQLGASFPRLVEEQPHLVAFLHPDRAAGRVGAVMEDKGEGDGRGADEGLAAEELLPQGFALGGEGREGGFGQGEGRGRGERVVGAEATRGRGRGGAV